MTHFKIKTIALGVALLIGGTITGEARELKAESAATTSLTSVVLQVTARDLAGSDTSISLNTGQTLTRAALKLAADKIDVAIVPPGAFRAMQKGVGPYKKNADQARELSANLRSLYAFAAGSIHPIVRADSGIESWKDLKDKRIFIGPPGGQANKQLAGIVKVMSGYEADQDYEAIKLGWNAAGQAFQDGQFDVYLAMTAVGSASISQLFLQGDYRFIPTDKNKVESGQYAADLIRYAGNLIPGGVPANSYKGVENGDVDIDTGSYTMLAAVNKKMSDDEAYLLTKTFWENLGKNQKEIAVLGTVQNNPFLGNNMTLHPGAIRYYQETGLQIPAGLVAN